MLLDVEAGIVPRLNATGAWIWDRLEQPRRVRSWPAAWLSASSRRGRALDDDVAFAREMSRRELLAAS